MILASASTTLRADLRSVCLTRSRRVGCIHFVCDEIATHHSRGEPPTGCHSAGCLSRSHGFGCSNFVNVTKLLQYSPSHQLRFPSKVGPSVGKESCLFGWFEPLPTNQKNQNKMIKRKLSLMALAVVAGVALSSVVAQAAPVTVTNGDLILGFRDTVNANDFQYSLGAATNLRDATGAVLLGNIGADLATFDNGGNWYDSANLYMGAVGVFSSLANPGGPVNDGDPSRTLYFSRSRSNPAAQSAAPSILVSSLRGTAATNIVGLTDAMELVEATTVDGKGALISDSAGFSNWSDQTTISSDFGSLSTIDQKMDVIDNVTFMGIANVEAIIDIYRMLDTTTGASPSGTVGVGQYVTSIAITQSGDIYAVPEPSTYALLGLAGLGLAAIVRRKKLNA